VGSVTALRSLVLPLALAAQGCAPLLDVQAGYAGSTSPRAGRHGGSVQTGLSFGMCDGSLLGGSRCAPVAVGGGALLRGRFTRDIQQVSLVPHAFVIANADGGTASVRAYARGGVSLVHLGVVDGTFAGGLGSPSAELGVVLPLGRAKTHLVLSGFAEYDVRLSRQPNEGFFGVSAGVGFVD